MRKRNRVPLNPDQEQAPEARPKVRKKKPFIIEARDTSPQRVGIRSEWEARRREWHLHRRYSTRKARDMAFDELTKRKDKEYRYRQAQADNGCWFSASWLKWYSWEYRKGDDDCSTETL